MEDKKLRRMRLHSYDMDDDDHTFKRKPKKTKLEVTIFSLLLLLIFILCYPHPEYYICPLEVFFRFRIYQCDHLFKDMHLKLVYWNSFPAQVEDNSQNKTSNRNYFYS